MISDKNIHTGNAITDGKSTRGWFIGSFINSDNPLVANENVEVKWSIRAAGDEHVSSAEVGETTTIAILVKGAQKLQFKDREILFENEGDYAIWCPQEPHTTIAIKDSVIIVVRFPSGFSNKA